MWPRFNEFDFQMDDMAQSPDAMMPTPEQSLYQRWSGTEVVDELKRLVQVSSFNHTTVNTMANLHNQS